MHAQTSNPTYRFNTNLGNIDVVLTPNVAPLTVANFLSYVNAGYYNGTIFHRLVNGFVVQGGGYQYVPSGTSTVVAIPQSAAIANEFSGVTNATGTIAMALVSGNINSATSEWFFNLANNGTNANALDSQDFTVFGQTNAAGIAVLNKINLLTAQDLSSVYGADFTTCPLTGNTFLVVNSILPVPTFTSASVESGASFASSSLTGISPGEIVTIFGQGLGPATLTTLTVGSNGVVTNSLAGTQVLFNGVAAPVIYTSAGQISVVAPYSISTLPTVAVTVSYNGIAPASALNFPVKAANPAIFTLNSSGTGDGVIVKYTGATYSVISATTPASVGDVLTLFGEGYGAATTATAVPDGTIITTKLPVPADPTTLLLIDGQAVSTSYYGGAPYLINGVLQVNFTVPQIAAGKHQIQLQVGSRTSPTGVTLQTK